MRIVRYTKRLYRQAHTDLAATKKQMLRKPFVWFALVPNYGENYGDVHRIFKPTKALRLLDISTMQDREIIAEKLGIEVQALDPDDQYCGGTKTNAAMHSLLEPLLKAYKLDGTIIEDGRADEACQGPTEVVLRVASLRYINRVF